jgi:hypothetical protein
MVKIGGRGRKEEEERNTEGKENEEPRKVRERADGRGSFHFWPPRTGQASLGSGPFRTTLQGPFSMAWGRPVLLSECSLYSLESPGLPTQPLPCPPAETLMS